MLKFVSADSDVESNNFLCKQIGLEKETCTMGRALSSDIVIPLPTFSRQHCVFHYCKQSGKWDLVDTSSTGTWVNDKQLSQEQPQILEDNDTIKLSSSSVIYKFKYIPLECWASTWCKSWPRSSPSKQRDTNDQKPLSQLTTLSNNISPDLKENASLVGYVPEAQLKSLAAEEAEKRKKLEQFFTEDHLAAQQKIEDLQRDLKSVNDQLDIAKQDEISFEQKQNKWKCKEELLNLEKEKKTMQIEKITEEYSKQLEESEAKLNEEREKWKKENETYSKKFENLKEELQRNITTLRHSIEEHSSEIKQHLKERDMMLEEKKLLENEKVRLEEEVQQLSQTVHDSTNTIAALNQEKNDLCKDKDLLSLMVDTLQVTLTEAHVQNDVSTHNRLLLFESVLESELQCAICTEIVTNAQTLVCGHTFCEICFDQWREKNSQCPICRKKVKRTYPSTMINSLISKMADNLTDEFKTRREQLVNERSEQIMNKRIRLEGPLGLPQAFIDLTTTPTHLPPSQ